MNTVIATICNKDYLIGLETLLYSIRKHNPTLNPLIIVYSDDLEEIDLEGCRRFFSCMIFRPMYHYDKIDEILDEVNRPNFKPLFRKFDCFNLDGADHIVFLDSDLLCIGDISYLFDQVPQFRAVKDLGMNNGHFNTGVMSFNTRILPDYFYDKLINEAPKLIRNCPIKPIFNDYPTDQEIINLLVPSELVKFISNDYNTLKFHVKHAGTAIRNCRLIHYVITKPWKIKPLNSHNFYDDAPYAESLWQQYYNEAKNYSI